MPGLGLGLGLETPRRRLGGASLLAAMALVEPNGHWNSVEGPGWIGTNGSMGEPGLVDPVGLYPDVAQWGGKKQAAFIAAQPHKMADPGFETGTSWIRSSTSTMSFSGGQLLFTNAAFNHETKQTVLEVGKSYYFEIDVDSIASGVLTLVLANLSVRNLSPGVTRGVFNVPGAASDLDAGLVSKDAGGTTAAVNSFRLVELPGNHAKAGTWSLPSDTARPTRGDGFLNYNGANNYFSLLNPVPLTDIGAIIHVCSRGSNGIKTIGTGKDGQFSGSLWFSNDRPYFGLRDTWVGQDVNLFTGPLVFTNWIDGSEEVLRVNGVEIHRAAVGPRTTNLDWLGKAYTHFHDGPQHAVQHLPPGVDLAMIQAWEAYGRTLNGAVFP